MARYQQAPYSDAPNYGNSYSNNGGAGGQGGYNSGPGYSDQPSGGYGNGGYGNGGGNESSCRSELALITAFSSTPYAISILSSPHPRILDLPFTARPSLVDIGLIDPNHRHRCTPRLTGIITMGRSIDHASVPRAPLPIDPMSSSNPYASASSPANGRGGKSSKKKWWWIGGILLLLIIIGAVLGGVLGTQLNKNKGSTSATNSGSGGNGQAAGGNQVPSGVSSVNTAQLTATAANRVLAVATDSYLLPIYATGTNTAGYSAPTVAASTSGNSWPSDPNTPSNTSIRAHPRLIAPAYKWTALTSGGLIANNPYFAQWNRTIIANASATLNLPPVAYVTDGGLDGSGVLDIAREMKLRVKNWAYAYRITGDTRYADRVWLELNTAAGNNPDVPFGATDGTRWNPQHFLDVAEFCNVFAIGYDWLYERWTDTQRDTLMNAMLTLGLSFGEAALTGASSASAYSWWTGNPTVNGNWNCVINGGLTMAALAIVDRDTSGRAQRIIDLAVPNARSNCVLGASSDGSWTEGPNYWYFGVNAAGEMSSALTSAYGNDRGLATANPGFALTSLYHMYVQGMTSLFNYADHGPNKFASTANSLMYWSTVFGQPRYSLYQRDRIDASEPFAMFWYDPATTGTWWDGLDLDKHFDAPSTEWATGRSTWASNDGTYWAMKGGVIPGHQNHGDMDIGDFVVDAMGQRWFGELGSGQYLAPGYFSGEDSQTGSRWAYYRKRTEGQNTILVNNGNQLVSANPSGSFGTSGTKQGAAPSLNVSSTDTAFFSLDMSSAYGSGASLRRGIRFLNARRQILIQDDISGLPSGQPVQWRAHTNATVSTNGATATLVLGGQTMIASILNAPSGVTFGTAQPTRASSDPALPTGSNAVDLPNNGVTVLTINGPSDGSAWSNQVLLNPQWPAGVAAAAVTPAAVPVSSWSVTSHN